MFCASSLPQPSEHIWASSTHSSHLPSFSQLSHSITQFLAHWRALLDAASFWPPGVAMVPMIATAKKTARILCQNTKEFFSAGSCAWKMTCKWGLWCHLVISPESLMSRENCEFGQWFQNCTSVKERECIYQPLTLLGIRDFFCCSQRCIWYRTDGSI